MSDQGPAAPPTSSSSGPMISYATSWWIGTVISVLLGVWFLLGPSLVAGNGPPMPIWLAAWLPYVFAGLAVLGRFFPSQQHTATARVIELHRAVFGRLPADVNPPAHMPVHTPVITPPAPAVVPDAPVAAPVEPEKPVIDSGPPVVPIMPPDEPQPAPASP